MGRESVIAAHDADGPVSQSSSAGSVFLSYASPDREQALAVANALDTVGIHVWLDRRAIVGGELWAQAIAEGIAGCAAFVVLCSDAAMRSHNVRQELQLAWHHRRPILPLLLASVEYPSDRAYFLHGWQWVNLLNRPQERWLPQVVTALGQLLENTQPATTVVASEPQAIRAAINLPAPSTALVGRLDEITGVHALLSHDDVRLVTLTGAGGTGKTRLALAVAGSLSDTFSDGVTFVDLASLADPALVPAQIAQALRVREGPGQELVEHVIEFLADKCFLLVLDNFEQVVDAAPIVRKLLVACPLLKVLTTSRRRLDLEAEWLYEVPPLPFPDVARFPHVSELAKVDAVQLFVQRAQAAKPGFTLTDDNARAVAEICARLEGLPLAIELAAARVGALTPSELLSRLGRRLDLLTRNRRDAPSRQQTLRTAIAWSYDRLSSQEQALFRRLAVFAKGGTLEAVEVVGSAGGDLELDVLDGVAALVEASLLRQTEGPAGVSRYRMLETLREYGLECLTALGEAAATRKSHADVYLALAEAAEPELSGSEQAVWLERLETEHDNLREALRWHQQSTETEAGLRLAATLWRFWNIRGHLTEGRAWLLDATDEAREVSSSIRAKALRASGLLACSQGDYLRAELLADRARELFLDLGDDQGTAQALNDLAAVARERGDADRAVRLAEESLALYQRACDDRGIASTSTNLGIMAQTRGDYQSAAERFQQSFEIYRRLGDDWSVAISLGNLGMIAQWQGQYDLAEERYRQSINARRRLGDKRGIALALGNLVTLLAECERDLEEALTLGQESVDLSREIEDQQGVACSLLALAMASYASGDHRQAIELYIQSATLFEQVGDLCGVADTYVGTALSALEVGDHRQAVESAQQALAMFDELADQVGITRAIGVLAEVIREEDPERAMVYLGSAEALQNELKIVPSPAELSRSERGIVLARGRLGEARFSAARSKGRSLPSTQVVTEALRGL